MLSQGFSLPLTDELFVAAWESYIDEAKEKGVYQTLQNKLPQFSFPVREGISKTEAYRAVTIRGDTVTDTSKEGAGLTLHHPEVLKLFLHPTIAGRIPVIIIPDRRDFVTIVRALSHRNEPKTVPDSMGACIIKGYNNWDRVKRYKMQWQQQHPDGDWSMEFLYFKDKKERYQDRMILLSEGPYSAVSASFIGLNEDEWQAKSLIIRLEHECAHYTTLRLHGSMRKDLFDELLADYQGIVASFGHYRASLFLLFLGLENYPRLRPGGRFENYREDPPLSEEALLKKLALIVQAASNLETIERAVTGSHQNSGDRTLVFPALSRMTLEELAGADALKSFTLSWQMISMQGN